jgi:hypothetical protein
MAHPKRMTALFLLFFATALLLGLTNTYLMRETEKTNTKVETLFRNSSPAGGQTPVRRPSVSAAYRPVTIDARNDPLAPVDLSKKDTRHDKKPRVPRPVYEPSQDDPDIILQ